MTEKELLLPEVQEGICGAKQGMNDYSKEKKVQYQVFFQKECIE